MTKPTKKAKAANKKAATTPIPIIKKRVIDSQASVVEDGQPLIQKLRNESSRIYQYQREALK